MSRPNRRVSRVWNFFDRLGDRAKCLLCQNTFAFSTGSTANLKRHLSRKHPFDPLEETLAETIESELSSSADDNQWKDENEQWKVDNQQWDDGIEGILIPKLECDLPQAEEKQKTTLASRVWRHYEREGTSAKCHHCARIISYSHGSTSNLKKHLERKHPGISLEEDEAPESGEEETAEPMPSRTPTPSQSQSPWEKGIEGIVVPKTEYPTTPVETNSTRPAEVWSHYDRQGARATCHYCYKIFSSGTTTNLKKHLSRKHPMIMLKSAPLKKRIMITRKAAQATTGLKRRFEESLGRTNKLANGSRRLVSSVWKHFDRDGAWAKCHHCDRALTYHSGTTSNLMKHLHRRHPLLTMNKVEQVTRMDHVEAVPTVHAALPNSRDEDAVPCISNSIVSNATEASDTELPSEKPLTEHMLYHRYVKILLMFCRCNHPLSLVDEDSFQDLVPTYDRNATNTKNAGEWNLELNHLPQLHNTVQKNVKAKLACARAISLSVGSASSVNNGLVLSVSSDFIDRHGTLTSALLDFSPHMESDTAENIAAYVGEVMKKFEIEGKVNVIVTDNPPNVVQAVEKLNIPHVPCFAHALQPIVLSSLHVTIQGTIDKVRHVVAQFRRSAKAMKIFKEAESGLVGGVVMLKHDVPGNWNSTLDMLDIFVRCKTPILACLTEANITSHLDDKDWDIVGQSVKVLQVLYVAITDATAAKKVTLSKQGVLYHLLVHQLECMAKEENIQMEVGALAAMLLKGVKDSLAHIRSNRVLTHAVILDPRYKAEGFMQDEMCLKQTYETVIEDLAALQSDENSSPMEEDDDWDEQYLQYTEAELYDLFETHKRNNHDSSALTVSAQYELNYYLKAKHLHRKADPLVWWENNKHFYPNLYKLAFKILGTPATCASSEGCCTKTELECRERNDPWLPSHIPEMVFIKYNHQHFKFDCCDG